MSGMYRQRVSKGELYLRGNYLKVVGSKNMLWKKFEIKVLMTIFSTKNNKIMLS